MNQIVGGDGRDLTDEPAKLQPPENIELFFVDYSRILSNPSSFRSS